MDKQTSDSDSAVTGDNSSPVNGREGRDHGKSLLALSQAQRDAPVWGPFTLQYCHTILVSFLSSHFVCLFFHAVSRSTVTIYKGMIRF